MSATLQEKIDKRASVWEQMKALMDSATNGLDGQGQESYDRMEKEYDSLDSEINRVERHANREAENGRVDRTGLVDPAAGGSREDETYAQAFEEFVKNGLMDMDSDMRAALRQRSVNFTGKEIRNAGAVSPGSAGGYLIPTGFREVIIEKMKAFGN